MDPFTASDRPRPPGGARRRADGLWLPALERPILDEDDESRLVRAAELALGRDLSSYDPASARDPGAASQSGLDARALARPWSATLIRSDGWGGEP